MSDWTLKQAQAPHACALGACEHEMIEQLAIEGVRDGCEPPRCTKVGIARPRITAWVVVSQQDGHAFVLHRVNDDVAQRKGDPTGIAAMMREMKTSCQLVEMRNPEAFPIRLLLGEAA